MTHNDLNKKLFNLEKSINILISTISNTKDIDVSLVEEKQYQMETKQKGMENRMEKIESKINRDAFWKGCSLILVLVLFSVFIIIGYLGIAAANEPLYPRGYEQLVKDVEDLKQVN